MTKHELLLKALRTLLIGACVELTFARGSDIHHTGTGNGQTMKMASCVASGVKLLGASNNETVLSLLIAQALSQKSTASPFIREGSEERDTCTLAGANDSSLMTQVTQQNPLISRHNHNSSSFLYDTKSQTDDVVTQSTSHPLQLESFQEAQSGCVSKSRNNCVAYYRIDDVPDIQASQQIVRELESEWENSQQIEQAYKQLPGDVDFDLALSEEVVSELQQTFDLSRELESTPLPATTTAKRCSLATVRAADTTLNIITPLPNFMATDAKSSDSTARTMPCYGSPELFSSCKPSHKKQTHLGRVGEQSLSSSFSPELFGPTPLVCRLSSSTANISATPSGPRSKIHTPKRSLLHDSTLTTPLCHVSQVSSIGSNSSKLDNLCVSTPQTQSKESSTVSCTASSPDLFS